MTCYHGVTRKSVLHRVSRNFKADCCVLHTMVLTQLQLAAFFMNQMLIPENARNQMVPEGMSTVQDLLEHNEDTADTVTRRSGSGFIIYLQSAPTYWFSKKQTCVESSSFGSEFTAMKQCCEYIRGLRYKLRMMGIPSRN